jgi:hypothetical protein
MIENKTIITMLANRQGKVLKSTTNKHFIINETMLKKSQLPSKIPTKWQ